MESANVMSLTNYVHPEQEPQKSSIISVIDHIFGINLSKMPKNNLENHINQTKFMNFNTMNAKSSVSKAAPIHFTINENAINFNFPIIYLSQSQLVINNAFYVHDRQVCTLFGEDTSPDTMANITNVPQSSVMSSCENTSIENLDKNFSKKSPNRMFYRNLIEEMTVGKKVIGKRIKKAENCAGCVNLPITIPELKGFIHSPMQTSLRYDIIFSPATKKKPILIRQRTRNSGVYDGDNRILYDPKSTIHNHCDNTSFELNTDDNTDTFQYCSSPILTESPDSLENLSDSSEYFDYPTTNLNLERALVFEMEESSGHSKNRSRLVSDCDSEDSFIVFGDDCVDFCEKEASEDDWEDDSDEESSESDSDCSDRVTCGDKRKNVDNEKPKSNKRVQFQDSPQLCEVHLMIKWRFAYEKARKGHWEEAVRDRCRFQNKVRQISKVLSPILNSNHRARIFKDRMCVM